MKDSPYYSLSSEVSPIPKNSAKIAIIVLNLLSSFFSLMQTLTTHQELLRLIDQAADEQWEELDLSGMGRSELPKDVGRLTELKPLVLYRI
ncbi:MAG: hypothetical protein RLZZ511_3012 [Cyanobacteriota bacterium]